MSTERNPDIDDCFLAGIPLRDAVALERAIEADPTKEPAHWWKVLRALQQSSLEHQQSGRCLS